MDKVVDWAKVHAKLIAFVIGVAITAAQYTWGTDNKWVAFAILVATGLGVYGVPNKQAPKPPEVHGKHEGPPKDHGGVG
jgi:drug/metabolite transporter (DMT)-like permease